MYSTKAQRSFSLKLPYMSWPVFLLPGNVVSSKVVPGPASVLKPSEHTEHFSDVSAQSFNVVCVGG